MSKLKNLLAKVRAFFPTPLPQGVIEFHKWSDSIIDLYGFPKNDSIKFALVTMIMHAGPTEAYRSKHYFALKLRAGAAKQVAGAIFHEIKERDTAQRKAAAEAETLSNVSSS